MSALLNQPAQSAISNSPTFACVLLACTLFLDLGYGRRGDGRGLDGTGVHAIRDNSIARQEQIFMIFLDVYSQLICLGKPFYALIICSDTRRDSNFGFKFSV